MGRAGRITGGDDPGDHRSRGAGQRVPHAARLHHGVERLGAPGSPLTDLDATAIADRAFQAHGVNPSGTITGPSYEYIVVGNDTTTSVALAYPAATLDKSTATLTRRVHLDDVPEVVPETGWNYNADGTAISLVGGNFVANDIYEFAYTGTRECWGWASPRSATGWSSCATSGATTRATETRSRITSSASTPRSSQPGRLLNDFRHLGFNETERGKKAFDGHMQWIAAGNGINMNYRFAQTGRTERNRQNHLYIEGRFRSPTWRLRPDHALGRQPLRELREDEHLPARRGDLLGERVLGEVGVAPAHDAGRHTRPAGFALTRAIT